MSLVLHPRAAAGDRLQLWLGLFGRQNAPPLRWFLDGSEVAPVVLRELRSARTTPDMVAAGEPRVFTGLYEFRDGITPGTGYDVQVRADGAPIELSPPLRVRTLPAAVPGGAGLDGSFNVLVVSCFHQHEDRGGLAGRVVAQLPTVMRPHLTLLMGDQVYLDLPTLMNFRDRVAWLAEKFESDYTANWQGPLGYAQVLDAAPAASVPDDHEYWNNFPHPSPIIQNSLSAGGRANWRLAARTLFDAFQLSEPIGDGPALELDVPPLSFLLLDNRTFRDETLASTLPPGGLDQLRAWAAKVKAAGRFGVVITGQSLFQERASTLGGAVGDRHLANYGDYAEMMRILVELGRAGRPVLSITGDVHFGRIIRANETAGQLPLFYEIISSPSSLVSTVGKDQVAGLGNAIRGLLGERDPWFRHGEVAEPPPVLKLPQIPASLVCTTLHRQKGNHAALLSFKGAGSGLRLEVKYLPIYPDGRVAAPERVPIDLGATV